MPYIPVDETTDFMETLVDTTTSEVGSLNLINTGKFLCLSEVFFCFAAAEKKKCSETLKYSGCWQATINSKKRKMMVKTSSATISSNY